MRKHSLIVVLCLALCLFFTGCGDKNDESSNQEETQDTTTAQSLQQIMTQRGHFIWDVGYDELAGRTSQAYIYSAGVTSLQLRTFLSGYNNIIDHSVVSSESTTVEGDNRSVEEGSLELSGTLRTVRNLSDDLENAIKNTIDWSKQENFYALNESSLAGVGTTDCDWLAFGIARFGYPDDTEAYLTALESYVTKSYQTKGWLSDRVATDYHRPILALNALGRDAKSFGKDKNGSAVNLVSDGIYQSIMTPMWKQGINGAAWGLIALDSERYEVPENATTTREAILEYLISKQLSDGGFALSSSSSDTDITALVLQALAPYYDSTTVYSNGKTIKTIVDEALARLSAMQLDDGGFGSISVPNAESTAQVLVALCSLQIDPLSDQRFITDNGKTVLDGLLAYYNSKDGGFIHSYSKDGSSNATAGESNHIATDQARYALVAYYRFVNGFRPLFDLREEANSSEETINSIIKSIEQLPETATKEDIKSIYDTAQKYNLLNSSDKSKISNRGKLQILLDEIKELSKINDPSDNPDDPISDAAKKLDADIAASINPINIRLSDENMVDALYQRYLKLSEKEQKSLEHSDDLLLARKIIEGLKKNIVIKEVFELISGKDVEYTITGVCDNKYAYTITFKGKEISNPMDFDARILTTPANGQEIRDFVSDAYYLNFPHQGEFPGKATVTISVDLTGSKYSMYYYNAAKKDFEKVGVTLKNMQATFEANRGGDYILSQRKVSGKRRMYTSADFSNGIVPKSVFEEIKGKNINLVLDGTTENGESYVITFNGTDIKNPMDFNMQIYFGKEDCENEDNIRKLADDPFIIHFMHEGEMPGPALVEIPETSLADGKYLLFYYVPEEMRAEFIDKVSAEGGATKFIIEHCSDYFIAKRAKAGSLLDTDDTKSDHGNNSVTEELTSFWEQHRWIAIGSIVVIVLAAGIIITATIVHKKQKRGPNKNPDVPS